MGAMLTAGLLLLGVVLLALTLGARPVGRLPLTPAVIYLVVGWLGGWLLGAPTLAQWQAQAPVASIAIELAVLVSLLAVGLRLRVPPTLAAWRVALLLAGPGMVVTIVLAAAAALWLLQLPWPAALLLAAIIAPTDPVLASEVQIVSAADRDAVRLSLTAEGGLNDGTALPAVMLALGLLGLHNLGPGAASWAWFDLAWPIGGGAAIGTLLGWLTGRAVRAQVDSGDPVARDELLYVGLLVLAFGTARATGTSSFVVVFAAGAALLWPFGAQALAAGGQALSQRLESFGARVERLVEAVSVLAVGLALHSVPQTWATLAFAAVVLLLVRPLSVLAVVRRSMVTLHQRRLVAWFGIRGIGTLFYLAFALAHGVQGELAGQLMAAALATVALSIVLHGVSATPMMDSYKKRRKPAPAQKPSTSAPEGAAVRDESPAR